MRSVIMPDQYAITVGKPHVVILGAGASCAAFPRGDRNGKILPVMNNLVDTITELRELLDEHGIEYAGKNFELIYARLYEQEKLDICLQIEDILVHYFSTMQIPDEPTLYDHLILSLRHKDVIASFNWDPLLWLAYNRIAIKIDYDYMPGIVFLHGNTAVGICLRHDKPLIGWIGQECRICGHLLERSKLLYPVAEKNYSDDPMIAKYWEILRQYLEDAYLFTIFGYSAPDSDVEAMELMKEAWGSPGKRELEQIEIIDVLDGDIVKQKWTAFICRDHANATKSFYRSYLARYPRRSCDAFWDATGMNDPRKENPIPLNAPWSELEQWLDPFLKAESEHHKKAKTGA